MIYVTRVARVQARVTREGIIYLSIAESIQATSFTHSIHAGEQVPRIKGLRRGMLRSHGNGMPQGQIKYLEIKVCIGLQGVHLGGAVPFFDSPSTSFSLLVKQRCMTT